MNILNANKKTAINGLDYMERFDMTNNRPTHHFISANTLFNQTSISPIALSANYSYGRLSEIAMQ